MRDFGKLIVAKGFKKSPKVQKSARSGHSEPRSLLLKKVTLLNSQFDEFFTTQKPFSAFFSPFGFSSVLCPFIFAFRFRPLFIVLAYQRKGTAWIDWSLSAHFLPEINFIKFLFTASGNRERERERERELYVQFLMLVVVDQNRPRFLFIFVLLKYENCRLQRDSNSDRRNRRRACWPLYRQLCHNYCPIG